MTSTLQEKAQRIAAWIEQGDDAAINYLSQMLLYDGDTTLRAAAAEAIGRIKVDSTTRAAATQALTKALVDENGNVRLRAVRSLGKIGGDNAAKSLALVLQDRETSGLMLAAELTGSPAHETTAMGRPLDKLRNEAWDIQFAAAEALGLMGGPEVLPVLAAWSERLLLSDVRVMSGEEKIEIVRSIMTTIFKKLEAGHIHEMAQLLRQTVNVLAHDESEPGSGIFGWVTLQCQNPVFSLFKDEISRRKMEYMSSLDNRDTLFTGGGNTEAHAPANVKDTLFNPINPEENSDGVALRIETSREEIQSQKADMLKSLNDKDALLLSRHMSSGPMSPPPMLKKAQGLSEDERQKKLAEYVKTLGKQDSLFVSSDMKPESMTGGEEGAFADEGQPSAEQKAAAYAASLGPTDTLWRPAASQAAAPQPIAATMPMQGAGDDDLFGDDEPAALPVQPAAVTPVGAVANPSKIAVPPRPQIRVETPPPVKVPARPQLGSKSEGTAVSPRPGFLRRFWNGIVEFLRP